MEKEENGLMVQLDLTCCIFDENESEEFQHFLEMVDGVAKPESDKSIPKINADEYDDFKMYLTMIKTLNKEVVLNHALYKMCMKELHHNHNNQEMDEMRVREPDLVQRIGDLEIKNNTLKENVHHVHEKMNGMYEHMSTLTADDWKAEGKWEEYKLMIEVCIMSHHK